MREASTRKPYERPSRTVSLLVPLNKALEGSHLSVDQGKHIAHYFARPTPPAKLLKSANTIVIAISKDRTLASANVGHGALLQYMSSRARALRVSGRRAGVLVGY